MEPKLQLECMLLDHLTKCFQQLISQLFAYWFSFRWLFIFLKTTFKSGLQCLLVVYWFCQLYSEALLGRLLLDLIGLASSILYWLVRFDEFFTIGYVIFIWDCKHKSISGSGSIEWAGSAYLWSTRRFHDFFSNFFFQFSFFNFSWNREMRFETKTKIDLC